MDIVETQTDTPVDPPTPDDSPLAEHEAQFGPARTQPTPVDAPIDEPPVQAKRRGPHNAGSQKASPEDVEQINALTKELRAKEADLAKIKPDAVSGSPRLLTLKRQIQAIEYELTQAQPKEPPKTDAPKIPLPPAPASPAAAAGSKPNMAQFEAQIGTTFSTYADAVDAYQEARDAWRDDQFKAQQAEKDAKAAQDAFNSQRAGLAETYNQKKTAFEKTHPDFQTKLNALEDRAQVTPVLEMALLTADNGPELVYTLANAPDLYDELFLLTVDKPVTDYFVALTQRRLLQRVQAASTGSAAPIAVLNAPRPPNPVRTGPIASGSDLPGDDSSLAEHEKVFGPRRRR